MSPGTPALAQVESLGDGAYLYRAGTQRSLFLVDDEGVIVTDPIDADVAAQYRAAIREITDAPVRYVVYSHYHWDRVSGGQIFRDEGAKFVAHERCAQRFDDNPNAAVVIPDITFTDRYDVTVGDSTLELHEFGPSHGDCLTVFVAQPANLLQVVDLVNPPQAAFPGDPVVPYIRPHNLREFFAAVERLIETKGIEQVVASAAIMTDDGGSQVSPALGPASIVTDQAMFWTEVYAAVETAIEGGHVGIDSFVRMKTVDLTRFEPYAGYSEADLRFIMRRISGWHDMGH
jgi:glyoxylase-like metal-dependent hydrolase (beta-lactamase superfamily II)